MSETITFALTRECDGDELVEYLKAGGIDTALVRRGDRVEVAVAPEARGAVETWLAGHEPALVPTPLDDGVVVLSLPGN